MLPSLALLFFLGGLSYVLGSRVRFVPSPLLALAGGALIGAGGPFGTHLLWSPELTLPPEPFATFRQLGAILLMWGAGAELQIAHLRRARHVMSAALVGFGGAALSGLAAWWLLESGVLGWFPPRERLALMLLAAASAIPVLLAIAQSLGQITHPRTTIALAAALLVDLTLISMIPLVEEHGSAGPPVGADDPTGGMLVPWTPFAKTALYLAIMLAIAEGPLRQYLQRAGRRFRASVSRREARLAVGFGIMLAVVAAAHQLGIETLPAAFGWGIASKPVYFPDAEHGENPFGLAMFPFESGYFVLAGAMLDLRLVSLEGVAFGLVVAATKVVGGLAGGLEGLRVGVLLVPRGAVDLVLALGFLASGVLSPAGYALALTMIAVTTLGGALLARLAYRDAYYTRTPLALPHAAHARQQLG